MTTSPPFDLTTLPLFHTLPASEAFTLLQTNANGLTNQIATDRLKYYGINQLTPPYKPSFLRRLWAQINNILIYILIISAIIAAILEEWPDLALIVAVIVINVTIGLVQEGKAEKSAEAIKQMLSPKATVIREGQKMIIDALNIVIGDIVFIQAGDRIPADLRLFDTTSLKVQEAMLTGESVAVTKDISVADSNAALGDRHGIAFAATSVQQGTGSGVVIATGDRTEIGKIGRLVATTGETPTQLQIQLEIFGRIVAVVTILIAVAAYLIIRLARDLSNNEAFLSAVGIAVAIIPEGLPAVVTITLAIGVQHMAKRKAIVRQLPAVETLGSVTCICSDKTGTLTKNEMTAVSMVTAEKRYRLTGIGYAPVGSIVPEDEDDTIVESTEQERLRDLALTGLLCNDGSLVQANPVAVSVMVNDDNNNNNNNNANGEPPVVVDTVSPLVPLAWNVSGDPTDVCLLTLGIKLGHPSNIVAIQQRYPRLGGIPFDSENKFQVTLHEDNDHHLIAHIKGAPEKLILRCRYQLRNSNMMDRVPCDYPYWLAENSRLSRQGLRILAFCRFDLGLFKRTTDDTATVPPFADSSLLHANNYPSLTPQHITDGEPFLTMLSLVAILDPPREECVAAIREAHHAGIVVKMITGDHPETAAAIGKMLGLHHAPRLKTYATKSLKNPSSDTRTVTSPLDALSPPSSSPSPHPSSSTPTPPDDDSPLEVHTGPEIDNLNDTELNAIVLRCHIFARANPETKIRIVRSLQNQGHIASMTGDGVNDAPALKAANIGVAMGITGTDVSKEAAKMVLADDNFATIVYAVQEGRTVWDNLRKILLVSLPTNMAQGLSIFFSYVVNTGTSPLTAMQVLWVNMLASVTIGIVLAFEPSEPNIMEQPPRKPGKRLLGKFIIWRVFYVTTILVIIVIGNYWWSIQLDYSVDRSRTVALNTLVIAQLFYALSCRFLTRTALSFDIFRGNKYFWIGIIVTILLQMLLTYTPGIQDIFGTAFINGLDWLRIIGLSIALFIMVEIEKAIGPRYIRPLVVPVIHRIQTAVSRMVIAPWPASRLTRTWIPWQRTKTVTEIPPSIAIPGEPTVPPREQIERANAPITFIATSASTFGYPTHPPSLRRQLSRAFSTTDVRTLASLPSNRSIDNLHITPDDETHIARHMQGGTSKQRLRQLENTVVYATALSRAAQMARRNVALRSATVGGEGTGTVPTTSAVLSSTNLPSSTFPTVVVELAEPGTETTIKEMDMDDDDSGENKHV